MGFSLQDFSEKAQGRIKKAMEKSDDTPRRKVTMSLQLKQKLGRQRARARAIDPDERMNKTERAYADDLQLLKEAGEIRDWMFEPFNLRLAKKTFYKPDFAVLTIDGFIEIHEVKGFWEDDARVKIKVAAEKFPWFTFAAVKKGTKKNPGWQYEYFNL